MDHLQTEARNPASTELDEISSLQFVRLMLGEDAAVVPAVASQAEALARGVEVIAGRLRAGGRLVYIGAGTSGRLGVLDASECPPTFNVPPGLVVGLIAGGSGALTRAIEGAEDNPEFGVTDLKGIALSAADVLVGIATSGRTPYVLSAVDYARSVGAFTIGLSCNPGAEIISRVDLAITPVVGPEVLSGSTRLKAGTATKLVLNVLSTGAMVKLGKTYGNLMVDVRATNEKLRVRTNRIVREATGLDHTAADRLLETCGRELKTALVAQLAGVSADDARDRLQRTNGLVRAAITTNGTNGKNGHHHKNGHAKAAPENVVLGIDGGGTGTVALLAVPDAGAEGGWRLLGRGEAGPSNRHAVGTDAALAALNEATTKAFAAAHLPRASVRAACLGLAGAGRPGDQEIVREWAARVRLSAAVEVVEDAALLLAAGTPDGVGVAVVAGTGSMAYGRRADGTTTRAGGWGPLLGDEGSGYSLALAGLRAAVRAADGRIAPTPLTERLLAALKLARPQELVEFVYRGCDRAALAALAPVVLDVAEEGDPAADHIVREAAGELAAAAAAAAKALGFGASFPVALAGGVFGAGCYRERFRAALADRGLTADPLSFVREPAEGAVRRAFGRSVRVS
ncbi:N-acetylmuramic acid 6-phosphate etherase [Gemmata obscuriglobus]|uniref:N-acetylmuramic acid 6-phosphate etherase n=1 Tax=Gemmata obscuriglobus TaxID=114 RepID=A0A2Z3H1U9_9BACT|nr:N-acetylmuramic acid 6-phosphate etherase [Gemmata obscuriglobus]AWM39698.1 N-acetylmuramic acid 6-phosphate etherase [Gemmata obscuriglobus]QEG27192.1 N-acetylmuramic acid 6-phosphate etherase [Gemmata obscuriglobus]VTS03875.1 n-acetylmuramic acid-6-phosphate etherase : N-acetylmuramic acid 6-phosphate etherase OS=Rhodopirellula baltica (strain SH1) GN=murQ PE=3 SV=1: SIS_2: BcrAD_BadFG [Gemmata obscuriglobus UQM 2246]